MAQNLRTGDTVKVIAGGHKGKSGKIVAIDRASQKAMVEGIGLRERHVRATQYQPRGSKKSIHLGIHFSNLLKTASAPIAKKSDKKSAKKSAKADKADKSAKSTKSTKVTKIKAGGKEKK